jgi:putative peptide zinc metalloprotease protein
VLETNLTGLWALPRRQRYGPFLAGLAFDSVLMSGAVGTRFGWVRGW